jgi:hypothetical protein
MLYYLFKSKKHYQMKKQIILATIILATLIFSACGSESGKRTKNPTPTPVPNGIEESPLAIIGAPKSICQDIRRGTWELSVDRVVGIIRIDVDSATALQIITDKTIVAVKVEGQKITLLRQ